MVQVNSGFLFQLAHRGQSRSSAAFTQVAVVMAVQVAEIICGTMHAELSSIKRLRTW